MKRKLAITFSGLNEARLAQIQTAATGLEVICTTKDSLDLVDAEIVFGHIAPQIFPLAKNLKWLHTQWAGVDAYLALGDSLPSDLTLTNSSGAYGIGIAEHLLTVTLMLLRKMAGYGHLQTQHQWQSLGAVQSLYNSRVTVVGLGDIGSNYALRCHNLGAKVCGVVRSSRADIPAYLESLFSVNQLDQAIQDADIIALCLPGTAETAQLFDKARLAKTKKGAVILNVGRGTAINTPALIEALAEGHLGGAALDVTDPEPLPPDSALWDMPNVIITPHTSGGDSLSLTQDLIVDKFINYLQNYLNGQPFAKVVDRKAGY